MKTKKDEYRDELALEFTKIFLQNQGNKTMSIISRIKILLGGIPNVHFNYNFEDCIKSGYEMADIFIEEKSLKNKNKKYDKNCSKK